MAEYKTCQKRDVIAQKYNMSILNYCDIQCTAVLYRSWSLKMGQQGTKMTLSTLTMSGDDFPGIYVALRGSNSVHDLISDKMLYSDTVSCLRQGGVANAVGVGKNDKR